MSISEARESYHNELEMAELRHCIRENKRDAPSWQYETKPEPLLIPHEAIEGEAEEALPLAYHST